MSLDGKILARAKRRLDGRRADNEREMNERRSIAVARDPYIAEIESEMRGTVIDAIGASLSKGGDPVEAIDGLRDRSLGLQEERALRLTRAGLPADYLTQIYTCPKCRDTGRTNAGYCECLMELYRDEQRKELSKLLRLGEETFDTFDLDLYPETPDPRTGTSARFGMEHVFELCVEYARNFGTMTTNLFFYGDPGLGKTFLSASIAKVVSEGGFSVVYETASAVFRAYELDKFDHDELSAADVRRLESCDLLILDDLGTELQSSFVTGALYTLLNERLRANRRMIISSNYSFEELAPRYSAAVMSRLEGNFVPLRFAGEDIRKKKG